MEKLINAMPAVTSLVIGVLIVIVIGWQVMSIQTDFQINEKQRSNAQVSENEGKDPVQSVELKKLTFFGEPGEKKTPTVTKSEDLPETNLRLVLRGVMAGGDSGRESALIEGPNGDTQVYHLDESLPGDARLLKVQGRKVVIERAGELETLSFPEDDTSENLAVAGSSSNRGMRNSNASRSEKQSDRNARNSNEDVRSRLKKLRERLSNQ